jgi:hypothetical protein
LNAEQRPGSRDAHARRGLLLPLALCAGIAHAADIQQHDTVQTRAECAFAAARALGGNALMFDDPPQATPPRATDMAAEYYWRAFIVSTDGKLTPAWLHCEIVPGSTATYAEVLRRDAGSPGAP